jgi:fibronectin-binding autotransporter adhesin
LVLTANNTFNGASTINGGTLQVGDGGATGTLPGNVANNNTLAFNRSDNIAFDGIISGSGELIQQGTGMLSLTSANSYSGKTTIAAGTLALATDGQIDPLSTIDNSSIFLVSEGAHTVGEIIGSGATFVAGSAQLSASSIIQNMLMIGGNFSAFIASNSYSTPAPVPEPSTLALMMSLGAVGIGAVIRNRRHRR